MKKFLFALLHAVGVTRFAAWWNRHRVVFLCYHGVTELSARSPHDPHGIHVRHTRFETHLDYLRRRYHVISLREYLAAGREGRPLSQYSVVLTFDDGFRNFLTAAAPRLAERGMPASVFIITDHAAEEGAPGLGRRWEPADDRTYLSWEEARTLERDQKIEVGSHTCSHPRLLTLSPEETERELRDSFAATVAHIGHKSPALSYPKGEYSETLARQARAIGYACAVTVDGGANGNDADLFALGRTLIGDDDDEASFAVRVSGLRNWLAGLRAIAPGLVTGKRRERPKGVRLAVNESSKHP